MLSWFGQRGGYDHVCMHINYREMIQPGMAEVNNKNYDGYIHLWPSDFATPADVKCAYQDFSFGFQAERNDATGTLLAARSSNLGVFMNGIVFHPQLVLPACRQVLNSPVYPIVERFDRMVLFWAMPNQLAVLIQSQRAA